jgi:hypothetical protein
MYNLTKFSLSDMTECGTALRKLSAGASSLEEVANRLVQFFYTNFLDEQTGSPAIALARLFKTHPYNELPNDLQTAVNQMLGHEPDPPHMRCLTLMATVGDRPEWCARQRSIGHQVIPLVSEQLVAQSPMISQLIQQLGLDIGTVLAPDPDLLVDLEQKTYNVFHVPDAVHSPFVPAKAEFVIPHQIQSVLGFGGMLPSGNLAAFILFSKVQIPKETAELFKTLALNAKLAMLPFDKGTIFLA